MLLCVSDDRNDDHNPGEVPGGGQVGNSARAPHEDGDIGLPLQGPRRQRGQIEVSKVKREAEISDFIPQMSKIYAKPSTYWISGRSETTDQATERISIPISQRPYGCNRPSRSIVFPT